MAPYPRPERRGFTAQGVKDRRISVHALTEGEVVRIGKTFLKFYADDHADFGETRVIKKTLIPGFYYITDKNA